MGTPESVVSDVKSYVDAGITWMTLAVDLYHNIPDKQIEQLDLFAKDVMAAFE